MKKFTTGPFKKFEDVRFDAEEIECEDGTKKVRAFVMWHGKEYSATATCNKADTYDFDVGCSIAFCKLAKKIVAHEVKYAQKKMDDLELEATAINRQKEVWETHIKYMSDKYAVVEKNLKRLTEN